MPAPFDFPGHYWDEAKGKFFKIEATATAPAGAQWSRQEVDAHDRRQQLVNQEQQRNRRRRQRQQSNRKDEAVPHKARPLPKRARIVSLQNAAGPSSSSSSSLHVDVEATLRWGRGAFDDDDDIPDDAEEHELATVRLFDRYPLLAHEVGEEASVGINRMRGRSHAGTTAALYARDFEYKGAVPILDESRAIGFEARNPPWDLQLPASERRTQAVPFWGAIDMPILSETKITCMYVHGEEVNPGAGIVYTSKSFPSLFWRLF
ncbi:plasma membrane H+-ATPase [Sporothrix eucalyptigena]|uniref:Plasma membrane H+-ATPase n=1 Tax=Sporothrix eucalyptigena TaxID=1812306 RepID=A0ABP0D120_9PEZI